MKKILLILFILISAISYAQDSVMVKSGARWGNKKDTSVYLAPIYTAINKNTDSITSHNTRIGKNTDSIASHNTRIGAVTVSDALKWSINGTSATSGSSYLGTSNNVSLRIATNGVVKTVIDSASSSALFGYNIINPVNQRSTQYASDGGVPPTARFISDGTNTLGVDIDSYTSTTGGSFIHGRKARGTPASPTAALPGDIWGLGFQWYLSDSAAFSGSLAGVHWVLNTNATKDGQAKTQAQFFTSNSAAGRRYNLYMMNTGLAKFYDSTSSTWDSLSCGALGVTGVSTLTGAVNIAGATTITGAIDNAAEIMTLGSVSGGTTRTNATTKIFRILNYPYTNANNPSVTMLGLSTSTNNTVDIGGGSGAYNAATDINFFTAANNNTLSGTNRGSLNTSGLWRFGDATTGSGAFVTVAAGTTTVAPLKLVTGTSMTTAAAGNFEYTTPQLFFTNGGAQRQEIPQIQQSRVSTQYDNTTTTLGNITGLTATVVAGKTYRFQVLLYATSNVAGGIKVAIGGTATATAIIYEGLITDAGATTQGRATALGTAVGAVTAVTNPYVRVTGTITVNAAGTLTAQAAANVATGTTSVLVGSTFVLTEML